DLHGVLLAVANLPVGGVPIAHAASANVACAYGVDVVFTAGLDVGIKVLAGRREGVGLVGCFHLVGGVFALFGAGGGVAWEGFFRRDAGGSLRDVWGRSGLVRVRGRVWR